MLSGQLYPDILDSCVVLSFNELCSYRPNSTDSSGTAKCSGTVTGATVVILKKEYWHMTSQQCCTKINARR